MFYIFLFGHHSRATIPTIVACGVAVLLLAVLIKMFDKIFRHKATQGTKIVLPNPLFQLLSAMPNNNPIEHEQSNENMIAAYQNINKIGRLSPAMQRAKNYFIEGYIDVAISVFNEAYLQELRVSFPTNKNTIADEFYMKGLLVAVDYSNDNAIAEARQLFEESMTYLSAPSLDRYFQYGFFLEQHQLYKEAGVWYQKAFGLSLKAGATALARRAVILNNLAVVQTEYRDFGNALRNFTESIRLHHLLPQKNKNEYAPFLMYALSSFANLNQCVNNIKEAEKNYNAALKIAERLSRKDVAYKQQVANIYLNMAMLNRDEGNLDQAIKYYHKALEIQTILFNNNPTPIHHIAIAKINNSLISLYNICDIMNDAVSVHLKDNLEHYKILSNINPMYWFNVMATLQMLIQYNTDEWTEAAIQDCKNQVEAIKRRLAQESPFCIATNIAIEMLTTPSKKLTMLTEEVQKNNHDILSVRKKTTYRKSATYLFELSKTMHNLAILHKNKYEYSDSEKMFSETLLIRKKLASKNPQVYLLPFATTIYHLANLQAAMFLCDEAEKKYTSVLYIYTILEHNKTTEHRDNFVKVLNGLAAVQRLNGNLRKAEKNYLESIDICRSLSMERKEYEIELGQTLLDLSMLYQQLGKTKKYQSFFEEATTVLKNWEHIYNVQQFLQFVRAPSNKIKTA